MISEIGGDYAQMACDIHQLLGDLASPAIHRAEPRQVIGWFMAYLRHTVFLSWLVSNFNIANFNMEPHLDRVWV